MKEKQMKNDRVEFNENKFPYIAKKSDDNTRISGDISIEKYVGHERFRWDKHFIKKTGFIAFIVCIIVISGIVSWNANKSSDNDVSKTEATEIAKEKNSGTTEAPKEWSPWVEKLPDDVNELNYAIEEKTLYRKRTVEVRSTTEKIDGGDLDHTEKDVSGYGEWSGWTTDIVTGTSTRDVESEMRYRYKELETSTSASPEKNGWEYVKTTTKWGDYGSWSDWTTNYIANSEAREVETKKQYSYRDISYRTEYTGWSGWSGWQDSYVSENDLCEVNTRTAYHYYYYTCSNCGQHWHGHSNVYCWTWAGGCGKGGAISSGTYKAVRVPTPYSSSSDFEGTGVRYINTSEGRVFAYTNSGSQHYRGPITQYQYRTRSTKQVPVYSNWSSYSDTVYYPSNNREVEERTLYRYCERTEIPIYHFQRWGDWSSWSTNPVSETENRVVDNVTFYRYRDVEYITTYYYKYWSEWSEYSETPVAESKDTEVDTKQYYRYKSK